MQVRSRQKAVWATAATAAVLVALAGCTMFRGNVKGNFQCSAPGGMCAPSSSIDDQALAQIEQNALPAGEDGHGDARLLRVRTGQMPKGAGGPMSQAQGGRGLKIVLPGRLDRYGRWREPQIVYADVSNAGGEELSWSDAPEARLSLAELASGAPSVADAGVLERQSLASGGSAYDDVVRRSYQQGRGAIAPVTPGGKVPALVGEAQPAAATATGVLKAAADAKSALPTATAPAFPGAPQGERR